MERPWLNQFFSDKQILTLRQPYVLLFQYTEGGHFLHLDNLQGHVLFLMERPWLNQFFSDKRILTLRQPYVLVFQCTEGGQSSHLDNLQGHAFCMHTLSALITDKTQMFLKDDFLECLFHPWYIQLVSYFLVYYLIWLLLSFFIHY